MTFANFWDFLTLCGRHIWMSPNAALVQGGDVDIWVEFDLDVPVCPPNSAISHLPKRVEMSEKEWNRSEISIEIIRSI